MGSKDSLKVTDPEYGFITNKTRKNKKKTEFKPVIAKLKKMSYTTFNKFDLLENESLLDTETSEENDFIEPVKKEKTNCKKKKKCKRKSNVLKNKHSQAEKGEILLPEIIIERCGGCNRTHFPRLRFCRWWRKKHMVNVMRSNDVTLTEELIINWLIKI